VTRRALAVLTGRGPTVRASLGAAAAALVAVCWTAPSAQQPQPPAPTTAPAQPPSAPATPAQPGRSQTPAPQADPSQTFRSNIDIVSLNVTVTDSTGRYITDLKEEDFLVFESGVKQDLTFFSHEQAPISLAMLLDSSASMELKLATLQAAASSFVERLKPADTAQIVEFNSRVNISQGFTSDHGLLQHAIQTLRAGGPTALHNAIYIALKELKKVQRAPTDENPRRLALVVFSDGQDTSSLVPFEEVLDLAKRSETAIYTIGLRDAQDQARGFSQSEFVLRQLALETGGRSFFPGNISDLAGVYSQIADELASQYALAYSPKNARHDGIYRRIVVQVSRPNLTSRTKQGYFAPTSK
jgi:Ca-activated chloride channel family protein